MKLLCWGCNRPQDYGYALFFCYPSCYSNTTRIVPTSHVMKFLFTLSALKLYKTEKN